MIHLTKGPIPQILSEKGAEWTAELVAAIDEGETPTSLQKNRYRHSQIKEAIVTETHGKCAYCESKIRHIAHGDIEHIIPKSLFPELAFDWVNLTLACDLCNENKSNYHGDQDAILDPYVVNPADHLLFEGAFVLALPGSQPGRATEIVLKLNRPKLIEKRAEKVRALMTQLNLLANEPDPGIRDVLRRDILENEQDASQEYAALARHLISRVLRRMPAADVVR